MFSNKKYKDLLKLANEQQMEIYDNLKDQYDIKPLIDSLVSLSQARQKALGNDAPAAS